MSNIAIVVVGYNRDKSLSRLLNSLSKAYYDTNNIHLIISIDKSDNQNVVEVAKNFEWCYGEKILNIQANRLGLRNHMICCGNLALKYGSIIVLEDDLYVSQGYYIFAKEAINKYKTNGRIAGISLYNHLWNVNCSRPFTPADDGTDAYFLQFAQSWGQVWTDTMWNCFYEWYVVNQDKILDEPDIPKAVTAWPDSSWLKYYIRYLVKNNKYFVYPRISLTTNFGDKGYHASKSSPSYQVPLLEGIKFKYNFPVFEENSVCYDVYFERIGIGNKLGIPDEQVCLDLYSTKQRKAEERYWITMAQANYRIHKSFGLNMRPHEINIFHQTEGNDIFCYDTSVYNTNKIINGKSENNKIIIYDFKDTQRKYVWIYSYMLFKRFIWKGFNKLFK